MAACLLCDVATGSCSFTRLPTPGDSASCVPSAGVTALVVVEPADVPPNPFYLSMADGALVASAVAGVWLLAWSFKAIRSVLHDRSLE